MNKDTPEGDRIAKVLSRAGVASRREAERMIADGRVRVNSKVIDSPALNVTDKDRISVDGKLIAEAEPPRVWLYHKPTGVVTSERDDEGRPTVFSSLPADMPRVMSVGRLDLNSEGLLLLTNDGELKRRLELPSTGWLRRYRVRIKGSVSEPSLDKLREGIEVDGVQYLPMVVTFDRQQGANAWLTVSLREGKNREIRRVMEGIGVTVNRLIRVSYGPFQLGNLKEGEVEEIKRRVLRDQLGLDAEMLPGAAARAKPVRARKSAEGAPDAEKPVRANPVVKSAAKPAPARRNAAKPDMRAPDQIANTSPMTKRGAKPAAKPAAKPGAVRGTPFGSKPTRTGPGKPVGKPVGGPTRGKPGRG